MPKPSNLQTVRNIEEALQVYAALEQRHPGSTPEAMVERLLVMVEHPAAHVRSMGCKWVADEDIAFSQPLAARTLEALMVPMLQGYGAIRMRARRAAARVWNLAGLEAQRRAEEQCIDALHSGNKKLRESATQALRLMGRSSQGEALRAFQEPLLRSIEHPEGRRTERLVAALRSTRKQMTESELAAFKEKALALLSDEDPKARAHGRRLYHAFARSFGKETTYEVAEIGVRLSTSPSGDARRDAVWMISNWGLHHAPQDLYDRVSEAARRLKEDAWEDTQRQARWISDSLVRGRSRPPLDFSGLRLDDD